MSNATNRMSDSPQEGQAWANQYGRPWSNPTLMPYTYLPHGEVLGRAPAFMVGLRASSGRASNHAQR